MTLQKPPSQLLLLAKLGSSCDSVRRKCHLSETAESNECRDPGHYGKVIRMSWVHLRMEDELPRLPSLEDVRCPCILCREREMGAFSHKKHNDCRSERIYTLGCYELCALVALTYG